VGRLVGVALNIDDRKDVAAAVDALTISSGGVVADVGFGGGVGLRFLLDRVDDRGEVHGVEVSSVMLSGAAHKFRDEIARGRLELHRASITELPFGSAVLDGVITTHTLYFVSEVDRAFSEIARSLKTSGQALIGLGDPDAMSGFQDYGFRVRAISHLVQAMESAGLTLTEHRQIGKSTARFHMLLAARGKGAEPPDAGHSGGAP
jgi:arsenite methyltransferase